MSGTSSAIARMGVAIALAGVLAPGRAQAQSTEGLNMPREQPPSGPTIDATKLTKPPKQTKFVEAEYPKDALDKGIMTDVVLLLEINAEGKVDSVGLLEPANPPGMGFDEAALVAAQQFEFEPAEMDGKKIAVQITYKYKFRFKPKPVAPAASPDGGVPGPDGGVPAGDGGVAPTTAAPAKPAPQPVLNFAGVLRERGTRLPLA